MITKNMLIKHWLKFVLVATITLAASLIIGRFKAVAGPTSFVSQVFQDIDGNGSVDTVVVTINGGEPLTNCQVYGDDLSTDWTLSSNGLAGISISSANCNPGDRTITFTLANAAPYLTGANTLPTIAYNNNDNDNSIASQSGSLGSVGAATIADDANPVIQSVQTQDVDNDGKLDHLKVKFSENIDDSSIQGYSSGTNYVPSSLAIANVTGAAIDATEAPNSDAEDNEFLYIIFNENTGICDSTDQTGCDTELTNQDLTLNGTTASIVDFGGGWGSGGGPNFLGNITSETSETDSAKPVLMKVVAGNSSGANTIAFTFSEIVTACNGVSTSTCGDLTSVGKFSGLGRFVQGGNIVVSAGKNTVAGTGTDTITVTLANQSGGYLKSNYVAALTAPYSTISGDPTTGVVDAALNQVSSPDCSVPTATCPVTATILPGTAWDLTPPTITSAELTDTYLNNTSLVAGGTFNTGTDQKADRIVFVASEAIKTIADAAGTRNDWTVTGAANEIGSSLTVIKASGTGTSYEIIFSGALAYSANPTTLNAINKQDNAPGFVDMAGNALPSGMYNQTYRACFTGLTCTGSTIGNVAVITNGITQPPNTDTDNNVPVVTNVTNQSSGGASGGSADSTGPSAPTSLTATVVSSTEIKLTWTDPTDLDFSTIRIYRVKNSESETTLDTVNKGVRAFSDKTVVKGDQVKYRLLGFDLSGNEGTKTEYTTEVTADEPVIAPVTTINDTTTNTTTDTTTDTITNTTTATTDAVEKAVADGSTAADVTETATEGVANETPFTDIATSWAKEFITKLYTAGIVIGKTATIFVPDDDITRGEFAKIIVEAFNIAKGSSSTTAFIDVENHWAAVYIYGLEKADFIDGYEEEDGTLTFHPDAPITRAEAMKILLEAVGYESDAPAAGFSDVKTSDWFTVYVNYAVKAGIVEGFIDGTFRPHANMTRAEVAKVVALLLQKT